jgi:hypothetical protein
MAVRKAIRKDRQSRFSSVSAFSVGLNPVFSAKLWRIDQSAGPQIFTTGAFITLK